MKTKNLLDLVVIALEDMKGQDIEVLDVSNMTTITDTMVIASGTSNRHVRSLADNVVMKAKESGRQPLGVEGEQQGDWILVDLNEVLVHVMLPKARDFYNLEKLWKISGAARRAAQSAP